MVGRGKPQTFKGFEGETEGPSRRQFAGMRATIGRTAGEGNGRDALGVAFLAVAPLPCSIPARALLGRRLAIRGGGVVVPVRPLRIGHLTDDELPRRDLVADVLEEPLACLVLSFVSRLGHDLFIVRERVF